ncbi:MAG TPA: hypothetical protein VFL12_06215 [Thermoanaerobaculia bacterium]|nr:hypothetical protein [Thermoanaerobaculia bacterium]
MRPVVRGSLVLAMLGGIAAADSPPPPAPPTTAGTAPAPGASAPRRPHTHFFVGEVVEIVAPEQRFSVRETLRDGSPKVTFFTADPATTVFRGKEPAAFADLRANDHVTIKYTETDKARRTLSIRITPSKPPKPAATAAPAKPPA